MDHRKERVNMTQTQRLDFLICELLKEKSNYKDMKIPPNTEDKIKLLRSLFNVRTPIPTDDSFLRVQDEYLQEELKHKGIIDIGQLAEVSEDIYLWQGDITTLKADAIVNAANSQMLGCFSPCHGCIDNTIHTYAGVQLRLSCADIIARQGHKEMTGDAKITPAFNLPSKYVIHTVGPIVSQLLTTQDKKLLKSCYYSCLELAEKNNITSIAFCCISTGEFHFPNDAAAKIAISTVQKYKERTDSNIKVIFNVFKEIDYKIYRELFGTT